MAAEKTLNAAERKVLKNAKARLTIARDMNSDYQAEGGLGGRLADNITLHSVISWFSWRLGPHQY
jgi:hypothetical protein